MDESVTRRPSAASQPHHNQMLLLPLPRGAVVRGGHRHKAPGMTHPDRHCCRVTHRTRTT